MFRFTLKNYSIGVAISFEKTFKTKAEAEAEAIEKRFEYCTNQDYEFNVFHDVRIEIEEVTDWLKDL